MSSAIWTPDALRSEAAPWAGRAWRLVEAQHRVSTLKLVDRLDEQAVLEDILEETKPPVPPDCRHLHYLLSTPFRYGRYPGGSRFRRAGRTLGVWYGALQVETAVAEMVFYRFLFFAEAPDVPWPQSVAEYTGFSVGIRAFQIALDIPPFDRDRALWGNLTDYAATQALADTVREAGIEAIRYRSVRDPGGGANLAVLTCAAFAEAVPGPSETWRVRLGNFGALALGDAQDRRLSFGPEAFPDPRLEGMNWDRVPDD